MAAILEFLTSLLQASLDKPYLLLPLFILEEYGVPFPWILSGLFIYAGYRLSQGEMSVLWLIPVNISGGLIGASTVYWLSRRGLLRFLGRFRRYIRLDDESLNKMQPRIRQWGPLAVFIGRLVPVPVPITSLVSGLYRIPFLGFLFFVALSNFLWNVLYMAGGVLTGHALSYFIQALTRPAYLIIVPAAVLIAVFIFLIVKYRYRQKKHGQIGTG